MTMIVHDGQQILNSDRELFSMCCHHRKLLFLLLLLLKLAVVVAAAAASWTTRPPPPALSFLQQRWWTTAAATRRLRSINHPTLRYCFVQNTNENRNAFNDNASLSEAAAAAAAQEPQKFGFLQDTAAVVAEYHHHDYFRNRRPLLLSIITEPDACDSDERLNMTLLALYEAVSTRQVDLVSIRVGPAAATLSVQSATAPLSAKPTATFLKNNKARRVAHLAQCLWKWSKEFDFSVVVSSDWVVSSLLLPNNGVLPTNDNVEAQLLMTMDETTQRLLIANMKDEENLLSCSILQSVHGIHVKESHQCYIPLFRAFMEQIRVKRHCHDDDDDDVNHSSDKVLYSNTATTTAAAAAAAAALIGTSAHDIDSAVQAYRNFQPDYFFVGTCFPTPSHPEKQQQDVIQKDGTSSLSFVPLEGPELPGQVARALEMETAAAAATATATAALETGSLTTTRRRPRVFAIGGIDTTNSHVPVQHGADGVATIRCILQANDPANTVREIVKNMMMMRDRQEQQENI